MTNKYQKHTERLQKEACEKNQNFSEDKKRQKVKISPGKISKSS